MLFEANYPLVTKQKENKTQHYLNSCGVVIGSRKDETVTIWIDV